MEPKVVGVIPARLESKRFYGKVLFKYRGNPLIQYLYSELSKSKAMDKLIIATDNRKVEQAAKAFGAEVVMTPKKFRTGSDRVAFVMNSTPGEIFVNIQADAFGVNPKALDRAIGKFASDPDIEYGTLVRKITKDSELNDHNAVKVVLKKNNDAAWFSRQALPYIRHANRKPRARQAGYYYHIGVYFFRRKALQQFTSWPASPAEKAESLEQLRILENGKVFACLLLI
ncbi:MAG: 3-deoxy-manno-octulosonate cytidylyltransferase [Candidatus Zixiibacteriota bacterium]